MADYSDLEQFLMGAATQAIQNKQQEYQLGYEKWLKDMEKQAAEDQYRREKADRNAEIQQKHAWDVQGAASDRLASGLQYNLETRNARAKDVMDFNQQKELEFLKNPESYANALALGREPFPQDIYSGDFYSGYDPTLPQDAQHDFLMGVGNQLDPGRFGPEIERERAFDAGKQDIGQLPGGQFLQGMLPEQIPGRFSAGQMLREDYNMFPEQVKNKEEQAFIEKMRGMGSAKEDKANAFALLAAAREGNVDLSPDAIKSITDYFGFNPLSPDASKAVTGSPTNTELHPEMFGGQPTGDPILDDLIKKKEDIEDTNPTGRKGREKKDKDLADINSKIIKEQDDIEDKLQTEGEQSYEFLDSYKPNTSFKHRNKYAQNTTSSLHDTYRKQDVEAAGKQFVKDYLVKYNKAPSDELIGAAMDRFRRDWDVPVKQADVKTKQKPKSSNAMDAAITSSDKFVITGNRNEWRDANHAGTQKFLQTMKRPMNTKELEAFQRQLKANMENKRGSGAAPAPVLPDRYR